MLRKILLASAMLLATTLAMSPGKADARRYYRAYRAPARVNVGVRYAPRFYGPGYYVPRPYGSRAFYPGYRGYGYGVRGTGVGITLGPAAQFYRW